MFICWTISKICPIRWYCNALQYNIQHFRNWDKAYRNISNISGTKSPNLNVSRLEVVFAQSNEARCQVESEDVVGAAPTGDAPTTSEWSTVLLLTDVSYIRELMVIPNLHSSKCLLWRLQRKLTVLYQHSGIQCGYIIACFDAFYSLKNI